MAKSQFRPGMKVMAKMRGFPPWPARIMGGRSLPPNKYRVTFYGTHDTAVVRAKDIAAYDPNKNYGLGRKWKAFDDALLEIERSPNVPLEETASCVKHGIPDRFLFPMVQLRRLRLTDKMMCSLHGIPDGQHFPKVRLERLQLTEEEVCFVHGIPDRQHLPKVQLERLEECLPFNLVGNLALLFKWPLDVCFLLDVLFQSTAMKY